MPDDSQPQNSSALGKSTSAELMQEPEAWQIREAINEVIEAIGHSRVVIVGADGWWEAFSHGLVMPLTDREDGAAKNIRDTQSYLNVETAILNFDDNGYRTAYGLKMALEQDEPLTPEQLKSLAFRCVAFAKTRELLGKQGFSLPSNPTIEKAALVVRSELAKDANASARWQALAQGL